MINKDFKKYGGINLKIKVINENEIIFDNNYRLEAYHDQDCCEQVYADFNALRNYNISTKTGNVISIKEINFEESLNKLIKGVEGQGFNMISKINEKFFVPCYNDQNGYYSSNLKLILHKKESSDILDITDFVKDILD